MRIQICKLHLRLLASNGPAYILILRFIRGLLVEPARALVGKVPRSRLTTTHPWSVGLCATRKLNQGWWATIMAGASHYQIVDYARLLAGQLAEFERQIAFAVAERTCRYSSP
jgi:hypothetical protein